MDVIEAYHTLKAAYPELSRQQGRAILRALVQQVGRVDDAAAEIQRLIPDGKIAQKLIDCIRGDFAHKVVLSARGADKPGV